MPDYKVSPSKAHRFDRSSTPDSAVDYHGNSVAVGSPNATPTSNVNSYASVTPENTSKNQKQKQTDGDDDDFDSDSSSENGKPQAMSESTPTPELTDEQKAAKKKSEEETAKNKSYYENVMNGTDLSSAAQIGANAYLAGQNAATNLALSVIGQKAAMAAAMLKLMNDLNDATVSFVKNIGSSIKSAAQ